MLLHFRDAVIFIAAMTSPLVSIVIPTYNRRAALSRAIASVFSQTIEDYELIVVDDGSTDDTLEMLAQLGDPRLRIICHHENLGAATARNSGIEASRGVYVAFLDSDDEWLPEKLERQTALMADQPAHTAASCASHFIVTGGDKSTWRRMLPEAFEWQRYLITHGCNLSPGSTLIVRRDVFSHVGLFDCTLCRYEDWDWLLRYLTHYTLAIAPQTLAVVNLSGIPSSNCLAQSIEILIPRWRETARKFGHTADRRLRSRFYLELAKSQMVEAKKISGFGNIIRALLLWPLQRPVAGVKLLHYLCSRQPRPLTSLPHKWHRRIQD